MLNKSGPLLDQSCLDGAIASLHERLSQMKPMDKVIAVSG